MTGAVFILALSLILWSVDTPTHEVLVLACVALTVHGMIRAFAWWLWR